MMHLKACRVLLVIALFTLVGCSKETKKNDIPKININPRDSEQFLLASNLFSDIKVILLETKLEYIIDHFSKILFLDNDYIIYKSGNSIIIFDGKGKYINKISAIGRGPNEYIKILNAHVSINEKLIYIADVKGIKIYDFNGGFVDKFATNISPTDVFKTKNGEFLIPVNQNYKKKNRDELFVFDSSLKEKKSFKSKNKETIKVRQNFMTSGVIYNINETVLYSNYNNDTIFKVVNDVLKPHWIIDLGEYKMNAEERLNISKKRDALKRGKVYIQKISESSNYFFIRYIFDDSTNFVIYSKKTKECISKSVYSHDNEYNGMIDVGIKNNFIKNAPAFSPSYINDSIIVSDINPIYFSKDQLQTFDCKEDDNPILFVGILKQ